MKLAFVSNYLNHHQFSLCLEMKRNFDDFVFISTDADSIQGYQLLIESEFVISLNDNLKKVKNIIIEYDVVIFGSAIQELVDLRMKTDKLTFLYSERFYKNGTWRRINPVTLKKLYNRIIKYKRKNYYVLCASAYLTYDLKLLTYPVEKCYKWGYFPETKEYNIDILMNKKNQTQILWCSRFLDWKHPDDAIAVAKRLKENNYNFHLYMIGSGELEKSLIKIVGENDLSSEITFLGSMPQDQVRIWMEKSGIFIFTSDYGEGWGAVMNEAMNSGCAVIASHAAGSVPFLVEDGVNGYIYKSGDINSLYNRVSNMLVDTNKQKDIGVEAYKTIHDEWNSKVAAQRLRVLAGNLIDKNETNYLYENGPCSASKLLKNNWK